MFTGIIEEIGTIYGIQKGTHSSQLAIHGTIIFDDLKKGDSVAVNGVCLTARQVLGTTFIADVMHETLNRSNLGSLKVKSTVNLERAMSSNGRFGGHVVSGHIDETGTILSIRRDDIAVWYQISASENLLSCVVKKGSIALDGISLTVADVTNESFFVSVIPHTLLSTVLCTKGVGDTVNLESDLLGKYVQNLLHRSGNVYAEKENASSKISKEYLLEHGFY
ncbi:riboflavin synthase [Anaeromicropila populeti]|uniref:Riboflavin synthase n=1 Tax=Anaeromicropila populeti TaxID=37658 RepID=A0A1I6JQB8_9FIRM|nr:riboflavin synthase [Anaeromicropila populeti]SFR81143.1 riboflavin synthase alpha chain [Anaeromicropila populeti]